jgi:hypothetical protein
MDYYFPNQNAVIVFERATAPELIDQGINNKSKKLKYLMRVTYCKNDGEVDIREIKLATANGPVKASVIKSARAKYSDCLIDSAVFDS